jgi:hypothetical protein
VAIAARSAARLAATALGFGAGFFFPVGACGGDDLAIFAPKNHTPAPNPTPNATHAQAKFTNRNVLLTAGRTNMMHVREDGMDPVAKRAARVQTILSRAPGTRFRLIYGLENVDSG